MIIYVVWTPDENTIARTFEKPNAEFPDAIPMTVEEYEAELAERRKSWSAKTVERSPEEVAKEAVVTDLETGKGSTEERLSRLEEQMARLLKQP